MRIIVGISGASGVIYGIRLLEALKAIHVETHLIMSEWAEKILALETDYEISLELVDHQIGKLIDQLGLPNTLIKRWGDD
jgi:3-polyprenyl-4-hydroxybenzoate decarboxylase